MNIEKNAIEELKRREKTGFFGFVLSGLFIIFIFVAISKTYSIQIKRESPKILSNEWTNVESGETFQFPHRISLKAHGSMVIETTLPDDLENGDSIYYNCVYMGQKVYIDGELVWSFATEPTMPFGDMRGSTYAFVPVSSKDAAKTIRIEMINSYGNVTSNYEGIFYGKTGELKFQLFWSSFWRIGFFIFMIALALFTFVLGYTHLKIMPNRKNMSFLYFSVLSLSIGAWVFTDVSIVQFFTEETTVSQYISFACLICIGSFYMGLCGCLCANQRKFFTILRYIGYGLFDLLLIFYIGNIMDPTSFMYIIFLYAFFYLIVSSFVLIRHRKEYSFSNSLLFGTIILISGVILSIFEYLKNPLENHGIIYFISSYGIYIIVLFAVMLNDEEEILKNNISSLTFQELAFTDILTNLRNRNALEKDFTRYSNYTGIEKRIGFFIADVNSLKETNDTLGHQKGDELIVHTANCIQKVFSEYGTCYRLGGDEFAVLLENCAVSDEEFVKRLNNASNEASESFGHPISIAIGYSECMIPLAKQDLEHILYSTADKNMYQCKKVMKRKNLE